MNRITPLLSAIKRWYKRKVAEYYQMDPEHTIW